MMQPPHQWRLTIQPIESKAFAISFTSNTILIRRNLVGAGRLSVRLCRPTGLEGRNEASDSTQTMPPDIPALASAVCVEGGVDTKRTLERGFRGNSVRTVRYLVYLNNRASEKRVVKTIDLCDQKTAP